MSRLMINLLGSPRVTREGAVVTPPRGNKVWALLAVLTHAHAPQSRQRLAGLMFADADDPFGALRWNISALRRLLGEAARLGGDPLELQLPPDTWVDTEVVLRGRWTEAIRLDGLGHDLLEGLDFATAPGLELWLTNERSRMASAASAILREAAQASLAQHKYATALEYATRLVGINPFDENAQVLLCRVLVGSGDITRATSQVEAAARLFRDELGIEPSESFRRAALAAPPADVDGPASVEAMAAKIEIGEAAIAAGGWQSGLNTLRGAVGGARGTGDEQLLLRSSLSLGSALVHAARGLDEEGATCLHEAIALADRLQRRDEGASARRELAYIELLRGRYERALTWLDDAQPLCRSNDGEHAWVAALQGLCATDLADYPFARSRLELSVELAARAGAQAQGAFARTFLGRLELLQGNHDAAREHLERGLELARAAGWTAFVPLPLAFIAETQLLAGQVDVAERTFRTAHAMSQQIGDPCWESLGARGLGVIAARRGEVDAAMEYLHDASRLCDRFPDTYLWLEAYARDALCAVATSHGDPNASAMISDLEQLAARTGMRELLARALVHRAALQRDAQVAEVAASLLAAIDNPVLAKLV